MRKEAYFFVAVVILASFVFGNLVSGTGQTISGYSISEEGVRVEQSVVEMVENNGNVRVSIQLKDKEDIEEIKEVLRDKIKHTFEDEKKVSAIVSQEELEILQNNSNVDVIEPIRMRTVDMQDTVGIINATPVWSLQSNGINLTGIGETVCVIDTGADLDHPALGGGFGEGYKMIAGYDFCADDFNCTTEDATPNDVHGHGSHVAGTIAASGGLTGVAPGANLVIIKAANATGTFWDDDIEKAIDWCVANASTYNISVISMSLGGGLSSDYCPSDPLADAINSAVDANISVIIASGNDGSTTQISGPACVESATPVGGTDKNDAMYSDGNRNSLVLLLAPGLDINSTWKDAGYALKQGTSMSTPHVAGAFALINQYRKLVGSSVMLPSEIEDALNDSGKVINDGGSGLSFSRIKIYQTLLDIDVEAPQVTLNSPTNDLLTSDSNQTFNCSAVEVLELANLTFNLWNSSGSLINQTTLNATSNSLELALNITLNNGTYTWGCVGVDNQSNSNSSSNYTLKIGAALVSLTSPSNNAYSTTDSVIFNCSVNSTIADLSNITLKVWNSTGLIYNATTSITGSSNSSSFDYNIPVEAVNEWNCFAFDEDGNSISADSNFTLNYDETGPVVTLVEPDDEDTLDEGDIDYQFSVSDLLGIDDCSLYINDTLEETDSSIIKGTTQTITFDTSAGEIDWYIKCYDDAGNSGTSSEISLTVEAATSDDDDDDDTTSSSSSSSTATTTTTTEDNIHVISDVQIAEGYTKSMIENDKIKFNLKSVEHLLELNEITEESVEVTITSDPITLNINLNETQKVDVDNDNFYELEVTYYEYKTSYVRILVKEIYEAVGTRQISNEDNSTTGTTRSVVDLNEAMDPTTLWILIGVISLVIFILGFLVYSSRRNALGTVFKDKYKNMKK